MNKTVTSSAGSNEARVDKIFITCTPAPPAAEAQLSTCLLTEDVDGITEIGGVHASWKCYLGYVLLEQLSIATDIQFHVFNFQICLPWLFTKKSL